MTRFRASSSQPHPAERPPTSVKISASFSRNVFRFRAPSHRVPWTTSRRSTFPVLRFSSLARGASKRDARSGVAEAMLAQDFPCGPVQGVSPLQSAIRLVVGRCPPCRWSHGRSLAFTGCHDPDPRLRGFLPCRDPLLLSRCYPLDLLDPLFGFHPPLGRLHSPWSRSPHGARHIHSWRWRSWS